MVSMERPFTMLSSYKKELWALLSGILALMAVISLYSFDPQDPSWFFISSNPQPVHNWCGVVGSYFSGLLMFLFGSASYLVVTLIGAFIYWLAVDGEWKEHWERIIAGMGVVACVATLCTLHKLEFMPHGMYGGYVGYYATAGLYKLFDVVGSLILAYAMLYASLVLLLRFSFMEFLQSMMHMVQSAYAFAVRHRIGSRLYQFVSYAFEMVYNAAAWLFNALLALVDDRPQPQPPAEINNQSQEHRGVYPPRLIPLNRPTHIGVARQSNNPHTEQESNSIEAHGAQQAYDVSDEPHEALTYPSRYGLPSQDIFIGIQEKKGDELYRQELEERAGILEEKLERFGVCGKVISIKNGPVVTLFEYEPEIDTKISKILALEDDLSLALQAHSIRILAPIPGRSVVGFEVSNQDRKDVLLAGVVQSPEYDQFSGHLPLILGEDTIGQNVVVDLAKMPHLLIAGSTGSGKSVALNAMLISLLCKQTPDELKLILIDPKRLEFSTYADIAHLLFPIVTDPRKSIPILRWVVQQMEQRYEQMATHGVRNIFDYNKLAANQGLEHFPFIVVVIDELSDLMLTVGREIEDLITRIAQMARAAGIHMIVATQRPSVDVITGLIKVNFPSRISFRVTSKVDSRTILDCGGADKLLGRGDMLFLDSTASSLRRVHGAYVSDEQIEMVVSHIRSQQTVEYLDISEDASLDSDVSPEDEELFKDIISFIGDVDEVSISLLQRKFKIGYNRSARIIDMLESRGLIMPADGGKTRRVIR